MARDFYDESRNKIDPSMGLNDITLDKIKSGEQLSNSWYKYKNKYYVVFKDGTWAEYDDDSMYKASQRTSHEQLKKNASQEYFKQQVDDVKKSEEYKNIKAKVIANTMANFKVTLDGLIEKFCKNRAVYTMYFKMVLNNNNTVLVDTTSSDWDENCLVSFKYELNGSGEANQFTLSLLYKPNDRGISSIITLETALLSNVGITPKDDPKTLKDINVLYNNCSFQYGYADDFNLRSPVYNGMITDYDCKIDNGNLRYTISGIGGLTSLKETRISAKDEYLKDSSGKEINTPLGYIQNIVRIELESKGLYTLEILDDIDPEEVVTIGEDYKQFNQKNIFQVINDILSQCITKNQKDTLTSNKRILPTQKQIFGYYVNDSITQGADGKTYGGAIYIYKVPSANGSENKENAESPKPDLGITFNWFGPGNDGYTGIVKDWVPKYDGSTLFGLAVNLLSHDESTSYYTMDEEGNIITVQGLGAAREGTLGSSDKGVASTIQEYSNWAFVTQYPYSATMTIIGCPCEVPIIGKIAINALMGSEKHHSSGVYYTLKKTDTINSSGFWSEFELFKITPTYDPEYSEIKSNDSVTQSPVSPDNADKANEAEQKEDANKLDVTKLPNYARDATESDISDPFLRQYADKYVVGKDGNLYTKDGFYRVFENTQISAAPEKKGFWDTILGWFK